MQIGAMNHPARNPLEEIDWFGRHGFDFVDFTLEPPGADPGQIDPQAERAALDRHGLGVVGPALQPDRPLPDGRKHPRRIQDLGDPVGEPEPDEPRLGEDDRVEVLLGELPQPGLDVPAQVDELEVRPAVEQLRPTPQAACADDRPAFRASGSPRPTSARRRRGCPG